MKFSFCIGNGESRQGYNVGALSQWGEIYGANALYRDFKNINYLICCDRRMAIETVQRGYSGTVYTREDWFSFFPYDNFMQLPPLPWEEKEKYTQSFHMGSGLHAVNVALINGSDVVVVIGHDLWGNGSIHNNIYKGTENYSGTIASAVDPSFWIKQFEMFFDAYPNTQFVFCQPDVDVWQQPKGWDAINNVGFENLGSLVDVLNQS